MLTEQKINDKNYYVIVKNDEFLADVDMYDINNNCIGKKYFDKIVNDTIVFSELYLVENYLIDTKPNLEFDDIVKVIEIDGTRYFEYLNFSREKYLKDKELKDYIHNVKKAIDDIVTKPAEYVSLTQINNIAKLRNKFLENIEEILNGNSL